MKSDCIVIANVSTSYFSIARYSGGVKFNDKLYLYCPIHDILVREDWMPIYRKLHFKEFIEAVKTGIKPKLPSYQQANSRAKGSKNKSPEDKTIETPSLFD